MISKLTMLTPIDSCGVWAVKVFHLYGGFKRTHSYPGNFTKCSVRWVKKRNWIKKKKKLVNIIIRSKYRVIKPDGSTLRFKVNACVLLKKRLTPKGEFIKGPSLFSLGRKKFSSTFKGII